MGLYEDIIIFFKKIGMSSDINHVLGSLSEYMILRHYEVHHVADNSSKSIWYEQHHNKNANHWKDSGVDKSYKHLRHFLEANHPMIGQDQINWLKSGKSIGLPDFISLYNFYREWYEIKPAKNDRKHFNKHKRLLVSKDYIEDYKKKAGTVEKISSSLGNNNINKGTSYANENIDISITDIPNIKNISIEDVYRFVKDNNIHLDIDIISDGYIEHIKNSLERLKKKKDAYLSLLAADIFKFAGIELRFENFDSSKHPYPYSNPLYACKGIFYKDIKGLLIYQFIDKKKRKRRRFVKEYIKVVVLAPEVQHDTLNEKIYDKININDLVDKDFIILFFLIIAAWYTLPLLIGTLTGKAAIVMISSILSANLAMSKSLEEKPITGSTIDKKKGKNNNQKDVRYIQFLLNSYLACKGDKGLIVSGELDDKTIEAMEKFIKEECRINPPLDKIEPTGEPITKLHTKFMENLVFGSAAVTTPELDFLREKPPEIEETKIFSKLIGVLSYNLFDSIYKSLPEDPTPSETPSEQKGILGNLANAKRLYKEYKELKGDVTPVPEDGDQLYAELEGKIKADLETIRTLLEGIPVKRRSQWSTPDWPDMSKIVYFDWNYYTVVVHESGSEPSGTPEEIKEYHIKKHGYADVGFHFIIDSAGVIYEGRSLLFMGTHITPPHNPTSIPNKGKIDIVLCSGALQQNISEAIKPSPEEIRSNQIKVVNSLVEILKSKFVNIASVVYHNKPLA